MINCIILDDHPSSLSLLSSFVDITDGICLAKASSEPLDTIEYLDTHPEVDLIFLDVEMPDISGFDFLDMLQERTSSKLPLVILTTGDPRYAVDGYQFDRIVGFLPKLVTYQKFIAIVHKVERVLPLYLLAQPLGKSNLNVALNSEDSFFVKVRYNRKEKYVHVRFNDLFYVQSQRNYVSLVTDVATYIVRRPLRDLQAMLPSSSFVRTHKSFIVNLYHTQYIDRASITLSEKHTVPISTTYREEVIRRITPVVIEDR